MSPLTIGRRKAHTSDTTGTPENPRGRTGLARVLFGPGDTTPAATTTRRARRRMNQPLRTRAVAAVLWTMLAITVIGGLLSWARVLQPPAPAASTAPVSAAHTDPGAGAFAALFLQAFLPAGQGNEATLKPFLTGPLPDLTGVQPGKLVATGTTVLRVDPGQPTPAGPGRGYWSVTVAATVAAVNDTGTLTALGLRYYQVPVASCGTTAAPDCPAGTSSPGYTVVAAPAVVSGPGALKSSGADTGQALATTTPVGDTVRRFLGAYLTGQGELARYCPSCPALPAPVLTRVELTALRATGQPDDLESARRADTPADGQTLTVQATARGIDATGITQTLAYPLLLTARNGQWTVTAITPAPPLAATSSTTPTTSTPAGTPAPPSPSLTAPPSR